MNQDCFTHWRHRLKIFINTRQLFRPWGTHEWHPPHAFGAQDTMLHTMLHRFAASRRVARGGRRGMPGMRSGIPPLVPRPSSPFPPSAFPCFRTTQPLGATTTATQPLFRASALSRLDMAPPPYPCFHSPKMPHPMLPRCTGCTP